MNKKVLMGIGIGAIAVGVFLLALANPNLQENKDTYFGFIETNSEQEDRSNFIERCLTGHPDNTLSYCEQGWEDWQKSRP
ncbi:MAG: hypothetical protein OEQ12_03715 [Nitrosopumilus sp.]|nr:hypothetical protein [Nitrosopumilus sp.]